jgi:hypothetical protein
MKARYFGIVLLSLLLQGCILPIPDRTLVANQAVGRLRDQQTKEWIQGAQVSFLSYEGKERATVLSDDAGRFKLEAQYIIRPVQVIGPDGDMFQPKGYLGIVIRGQGYRTTRAWGPFDQGEDQTIELEKADAPNESPVVLHRSFFAAEGIRRVKLEPASPGAAAQGALEFEVLEARRLKDEHGFHWNRRFECLVVSSTLREFKVGTRFQFSASDMARDPGCDRLADECWGLGRSDRLSLAITNIREPDPYWYAVSCSVAGVRRANRDPDAPWAGLRAEKQENMVALYAAYDCLCRKDYAGGESAYRALLKRDLVSSTAVLTRFYLGVSLMLQKNYAAAIGVFHSVLHMDDRHIATGDSGEIGRNCKYSACRKISECYELQGALREALEYSILARDNYKYQTDCDSCAKYESQVVESRVVRMEQKMAKDR